MQVHLRILGQVQGVFFRRSAKEEADKLGLVGWVRNDHDGSVEAMAVGAKGKLSQFIRWCKKGPPLSKVERVEIDWPEGDATFDSFDIL